MTRSVQFPVAVHVLVALAVLEEEFVTSDVLAESVGTNPAVVRRLLQLLKRAGLVIARSGAYGGSALARSPETITLLEVHRAVQESAPPAIHEGDPTCWIARGIGAVVPTVLAGAEAARLAALGDRTIAELAAAVRSHRAGGRGGGG